MKLIPIADYLNSPFHLANIQIMWKLTKIYLIIFLKQALMCCKS